MIFFAVVAVLSATSGLGVVFNRRPLYSALSLVVNMLSLALLFLTLQAQFLAAVQVIVYAGAVMVLFVFVIALLNPAREERPGRDLVQAIIAVGLGLALTAIGAFTFLGGRTFSAIASGVAATAGQEFGGIQVVGNALYRDFAFAFEATSLLLVVAAVGAVYLSRGK